MMSDGFAAFALERALDASKPWSSDCVQGVMDNDFVSTVVFVSTAGTFHFQHLASVRSYFVTRLATTTERPEVGIGFIYVYKYKLSKLMITNIDQRLGKTAAFISFSLNTHMPVPINKNNLGSFWKFKLKKK